MKKKIAVIFPKDSEAIFNINSSDTFGGATAQLYNIAKELSNYSDFETYSIISDYPIIDFIDADKFNFIKSFKNSDNPLKKILTYHKNLKTLKPDIVIQRGLTLFSCLLALYCRIYKIKFMFMFAHDREVRGRYQKNNKRCSLFFILTKFSSLLISQSRDQEEYLINNYKKGSIIIKSGYEINKLSNVKKKTILWVGRLEPWKRPEKFIELAGAFPNENFIMIAPLIKGYEDYGKNIHLMAEKIKSLKIIPFVHFQEIDTYYREAKIFINTSESEGFPNTFIQACKNGTPLISLNVNPDCFINEYNCGLFCKNDSKLLKENLSKMLTDNNLFNELSDSSYNYAAEFHNIKHNTSQLLKHFK